MINFNASVVIWVYKKVKLERCNGLFKMQLQHHLDSTFCVGNCVCLYFFYNNYDWTRNTISDLGSQDYDGKLIMQFGFLAFGLTLTAVILLNSLTWRTTPILIYGLCVGLTGIFCTKPFFNFDNYSASQATIHSALAQIAGVTFTLGILLQLFYSADKSEKWLHFIFFILVVGLSASFGL